MANKFDLTHLSITWTVQIFILAVICRLKIKDNLQFVHIYFIVQKV